MKQTIFIKKCMRACKRHWKIIVALIAMLFAGAALAIVLLGGWYMHTYDMPEYERFGAWPLPVKKEIPVWEKKVSLEGQSLKIGMITDTQVHPNRVYRWGSTYNRYLKKSYTDIFAKYREEMLQFEPDFTIHLGDIIEGTGDPLEVGEIGLQLVKEELEIPGIPMYWVIGNHDLRSVARRQFQEALEIDYINHVFDQGPYRFIIFDANYRKTGVPQNPISGDYVPGFVSKENLAWLEKQLQTDQHVYIFMHQSLVPQESLGKGTIVNRQEVRDLLAQYKVSAVFDGHVERRYFNTHEGGVDYYAFPGTKKSPRYPGAYYTMTLHEGTPEIMMFFIDPLTGEATAEPFFKEDVMERGYSPEERAQRQAKTAAQNDVSDKKEEMEEDGAEDDIDDTFEEEIEDACTISAECDFDELCVQQTCQDIKELQEEL